LHLLNQPVADVDQFSNTITDLRREIKFCTECFNISDQDICAICTSVKRDRTVVCVVEDTQDVMAIENTSQFNGVYHVLNGLISPMDGIGPSDLNIDALVERIKKDEITEVILAVSATMEGDTTIFYIYKKLKQYPVKITTIARGIAFGGELEYVDEITLGRSIVTRIPYENSLIK
jgi:recombination protein RecR